MFLTVYKRINATFRKRSSDVELRFDSVSIEGLAAREWMDQLEARLQNEFRFDSRREWLLTYIVFMEVAEKEI